MICASPRRQGTSVVVKNEAFDNFIGVPLQITSLKRTLNATTTMAETATPMMPLHPITMETPLQEAIEEQHVDHSIPTPAPIEVFSEGGPTSVAYFSPTKKTGHRHEKRIDEKIDSGHASAGSSDEEEPDVKPKSSKISIPASKWTPMCHPRVSEVSKEVDGDFLERWGFPAEKAKKKFLAAGFSRVTCLYFPLALDDRIHFACRLLTILFLVDGKFLKIISLDS